MQKSRFTSASSGLRDSFPKLSSDGRKRVHPADFKTWRRFMMFDLFTVLQDACRRMVRSCTDHHLSFSLTPRHQTSYHLVFDALRIGFHMNDEQIDFDQYDTRQFPPIFWIGAFVLLAFWLWEIGFWKDDLEPIRKRQHDFHERHTVIPTEKAGDETH